MNISIYLNVSFMFLIIKRVFFYFWNKYCWGRVLWNALLDTVPFIYAAGFFSWLNYPCIFLVCWIFQQASHSYSSKWLKRLKPFLWIKEDQIPIISPKRILHLSDFGTGLLPTKFHEIYRIRYHPAVNSWQDLIS